MCSNHFFCTSIFVMLTRLPLDICSSLDCKTVRIFAYSSTREQSNKRSGTRLKTESETGERRYGRVRLARFACIRLLRHSLPISLLILRKKPTVLQSGSSLIVPLSVVGFCKFETTRYNMIYSFFLLVTYPA